MQGFCDGLMTERCRRLAEATLCLFSGFIYDLYQYNQSRLSGMRVTADTWKCWWRVSTEAVGGYVIEHGFQLLSDQEAPCVSVCVFLSISSSSVTCVA